MTTEESCSLTPQQARALFDILTHHETYTEIEGFKEPTAIHTYGPPFQDDTVSTSPLLQTLLTRFLLPLPGVKELPSEFWPGKVEPLIAELSSANLSESFDKGDCGQRKTLATAVSALLEYIARGTFGGLPKRDLHKKDDDYDLSDPRDLVYGFEDMLQGLVYGDILDPVAQRVAETNQLTDHTKMVQAAHRFILINAASFMHYTLIVSSKGPALLGLLESAHRLVPYTIIRQTLRVGNAATMINGMVKIVLAKASVSAMTNWLGISQGLDEGMNLMQTIISTVLGWDIRGLKKKVAQVEKSADIPSHEQLQRLKDYIQQSQEEQKTCREESRKTASSLTSVILQPAKPLSPAVTASGANYLALQLAIEDRARLTSVLCHHHPDITTPLVRSLVSAYEPVIRSVHEAVDLPAGLTDAENFINDLIALAKPQAPKSNGDTPAAEVPVSKFVALCETHQGSMHRFLHQLAKNGPELTGWYKDWVRLVTKQFRTPEGDKANADSLTARMSQLLSYLSAPAREAVVKEVDAHADYLATLSSSSDARAKSLVAATDGTSTNSSATKAGPGMFLAKWQALLDDTDIGPGRSGVKKAGAERSADVKGVEKEAKKAPKTNETVKHLLAAFREMIREYGQPTGD